MISACLEVTTNQSGVTVPVTAGPNLRVIDTDAGQSCNTTTAVGAKAQTLEEPISWNQSGPAGPAGATGATGPRGASGGNTVASVLVAPPATSTTPIGTATVPLPIGGGKTEKVALYVAGWSIQSSSTTYEKTTTAATTGNGKGSMLISVAGVAGESQDSGGRHRISILLAQVAGSGTVIPRVTLAVRDAHTGMGTGQRSSGRLTITLTQVHIGEVDYGSKTTKGKTPTVDETLVLSYGAIVVKYKGQDPKG